MDLTEIVTLGAVVLSFGSSTTLSVHLSSIINSRFDNFERKFDSMERKFESIERKFESIERRLEMIQDNTHDLDLRVTKLEPRYFLS